MRRWWDSWTEMPDGATWRTSWRVALPLLLLLGLAGVNDVRW